MMSLRSRSNWAGAIGLLTLPHQMLPSLEGSLTVNLSFGERAGAAHQWSLRCDLPFLPANRVLVEGGG